MARYLVVAHQTAGSPELRAALRRLQAGDASAAFVLLVPATPIEHVAGWSEGETTAVARRAGEEARAKLEADGLTIEAVEVGDPNPVYAVSDEIDERSYDGVIVSTLHARVSRWLGMDAVSRIRRQVKVPVTHVEAAEPAFKER
jgi:hypothetical protein